MWNFTAPPTSTLKDPVKTFAANGTYVVTLTGTNELTGASGTKKDSVKITSVGIFQTESVDRNIKMNPNPASDKIVFSLTETFDRFDVTIIDLAGSKVYSERQYGKTSGKVPMNVSTLPEGQYMVIIDTEDGFSTKKLTITK